MYVCVYMYVGVNVSMCVGMDVCMCVYMYVYVCMYVCMYGCIMDGCMCVYVCMYVFICSLYLHTRNIFSCPDCLKFQNVAFHFLRQCLYVEPSSSLHESPYWQFVIGKSANWLYSMLIFFKSFFTISSVFSSGNGFRYAT